MILDTPVGYQKLCQVLVEEGDCRWMYPDQKGWVSTGVGFKIDASGDKEKQGWEPALRLPWKLNGATPPEGAVTKEWTDIKARRAEGASHPGQWWESQTTLRITSADVQKYFEGMARGQVSSLKGWRWFREFDSFPGDAQVGILARSWAELKQHYRFNRACCYRDWLWAADESPYQEIVPSRRDNLSKLFRNAATVEGNSTYNPAEIYWPALLPIPSTAPYHFRTLVQTPDWTGAFTYLNGYNVKDQLRMLDSLPVNKLWQLKNMSPGVKGSNSWMAWDRMEFAMNLVWAAATGVAVLPVSFYGNAPAGSEEDIEGSKFVRLRRF